MSKASPVYRQQVEGERDSFSSIERLAEWAVAYDMRAKKAARKIRRRRLGDWSDIRQEALYAAMTAIRYHARGRAAALSTYVVNCVGWHLMTVARGLSAAQRDDALRIAEELQSEPFVSESAADAAHWADTLAALDEALRFLTARERDVVLLRFGFDDCNPRTLRVTGKALGMSIERVRQIESRAIRKLGRPSSPGSKQRQLYAMFHYD